MSDPTQKSPNLEVVSSSEAAAAAHSERRRLPRLNLTSEQFRLTATGKIFSVTDLSLQGMALRVLELDDLLLFPVATHLEGNLNLHGSKHAVSAKVRNVYGDRVGCEFETLKEDVRTALMHFLDPAELGRELKPIPASEPGMLWYHGPSGTDLLLRRAPDGRYVRLALFLLGTFVQWTEEEGLRTGRTSASTEQSEVRGIVRLETLMLDADAKPDDGKLEIAKTLILSSNLPQDLKTLWVRRLKA